MHDLLGRRAQMCSFCVMSKTAILRTRIEPHRKARAEAILRKLGITTTQVINMLYAQIEQRKGLPFPVRLEDNSDVLRPLEQIAASWGRLDNENFDCLVPKK